MDLILIVLMMKIKELSQIRQILSADKIYLIGKFIILINSSLTINKLIKILISKIDYIKMMTMQFQQKMMEARSIQILVQKDQKINHLNLPFNKLQIEVNKDHKNLRLIMMIEIRFMKQIVDNIQIQEPL